MTSSKSPKNAKTESKAKVDPKSKANASEELSEDQLVQVSGGALNAYLPLKGSTQFKIKT